MHSTNRLPTLTISFRRAEMKAFWILTSAVFSVMLGTAAAALGARAPWVWGAAGLSVLLPGLLWSRWFEIGISTWNKAVRLSAAVLRSYVLKISYYLLLGMVSRTGSSLQLLLGDQEVSRWIPRGRHDSAFEEDGPLSVRSGWAQGLTLARRPGKAWMVCLLPVMELLLLLRDEQQESAPPSSTYTLY